MMPPGNQPPGGGYPPPGGGYPPPGGGYPPPGGGYPPPGYGQPPPGYGHAPPGYGQPPPGYGVPQPHGALQQPPPVRLSAGLYITMYILCSLAGAILVVVGTSARTQEAIPAIPIPFIVLGIFQLVFIYKMYKAIADGVTRPTPGLAVGLMFVPFVSLIWLFIVWGKFPGQYNQFVQRHGRRVPPLGAGLYVCALVLGFIPLVGMILWCIVLGKTAGAVNVLTDQRR